MNGWSLVSRKFVLYNAKRPFNKAWIRVQTFGKFDIQKLCYEHVRTTFNLSAQLVVRRIAKVADAYKIYKRTSHCFTTEASLYDGVRLKWHVLELRYTIMC